MRTHSSPNFFLHAGVLLFKISCDTRLFSNASLPLKLRKIPLVILNVGPLDRDKNAPVDMLAFLLWPTTPHKLLTHSSHSLLQVFAGELFLEALRPVRAACRPRSTEACIDARSWPGRVSSFTRFWAVNSRFPGLIPVQNYCILNKYDKLQSAKVMSCSHCANNGA